MSDYEAQAQAFLNRFGLEVKAAFKGDRCPQWTEPSKSTSDACHLCHSVHGDRYRVSLKRKGGKSFSFDFWDSLANKRDGNRPTAYDVLACISGDVYAPGTFSNFCSEYGCDQDSRKAHDTFKRVSKFSERLRAFLSDEERIELAEIS